MANGKASGNWNVIASWSHSHVRTARSTVKQDPWIHQLRSHHEGSQTHGTPEPAMASGHWRKASLRQVVRSTNHHLLLDLFSLISPADSGPDCFQLATAAVPNGCERDGCRLLTGRGGSSSCPPLPYCLLHTALSSAGHPCPKRGTQLGLLFKLSSLVKKPSVATQMTHRSWGHKEPLSCLQPAKIRVGNRSSTTHRSKDCARPWGAGEGGQSILSCGTYAMDTYSRLQSPELPIWH